MLAPQAEADEDGPVVRLGLASRAAWPAGRSSTSPAGAPNSTRWSGCWPSPAHRAERSAKPTFRAAASSGTARDSSSGPRWSASGADCLTSAAASMLTFEAAMPGGTG